MVLGGNGMGRKFRVSKEMLQKFETLTYEESVKLYSALALLEKYGVTDSVLEMWGKERIIVSIWQYLSQEHLRKGK